MITAVQHTDKKTGETYTAIQTTWDDFCLSHKPGETQEVALKRHLTESRIRTDAIQAAMSFLHL